MDKPLRILHLEDNPDFADLVSSMLQREGLAIEFVPVTDFKAYLAALDGEPFDIILADYLLPGCNGIQALEAAHGKRPDTPFLLISGTIGEQAAIESLRCGATDYVLKSALDRLVPAVRRAVSEARERVRLRRAEAELVRREKYFRTLTENSLDVLTVLSQGGIFLYNSQSIKTVLGYEPAELFGRDAFELLHPDDLTSARQAFKTALKSPGLRITQQFRYRHKDGSWRHLEAVGQNRFDDPDIGALVMNSRDISDRKRAEAEVQASARQYRLIFDENPLPMWVTDLETGEFLDVNEAAVRHYGYSRSEFLSMTVRDIRPAEHIGKLDDYFTTVVKRSHSGSGRAGLWRHRNKNGTSMDVEITWSIIAFRGSEALLTMADDVTERRRNEQRESALGKLSAGLSLAMTAERAAHIIKDVADELLGWDCFALGLYIPEIDALRPVLKIDTRDGRRQEVLVQRLRDKLDAMVRRVIETGAELVLVANPTPATETELFTSKSHPAPSQLFVAVKNGTKTIGVLSIQSHRTNAYDQDDLDTLQLLANQSAGPLERIHVEQALRESELRFRELFEGSPDAIVVVDLNARVLDVNPPACRLWDARSDELVGRNIQSLAKTDREQEIVSTLSQVVAGATTQWEGACVAGNGSEIPVEVSGSCIEYGDKQAVLLHVRDIRERRQAADALRKSEASLSAAQRIAHLGSWELDLRDAEKIEANELRWSDETYRIFGYEPRQVAVTNDLFYQCVHPEDRERVKEAIRLAVNKVEDYSVEHRIVRPTGEERMVREQAEFAVDPQGKPTQLRGIVLDITERKRLEEQLRQSQKMEAIGQLAGGVAHDFNNILTVIHGHASLLLADRSLPLSTAKSAQQIAQAVERAAGLTRQLLTFSRRQVMQPRRLDMNEVVSTMTMMLGRILGEDITLQLGYSPRPAFIQADARMIEQILLNLAVNARDAMPKGGQLVIRIAIVDVNAQHVAVRPEARVGEFVCLAVADNGCGIPPEILRRIFEPFFTTKEVGKGTGLGLATVYGIVRQHQGWIEVESEPGAGAVFRVYLPVSTHGSGGVEATLPTPEVRGGKETILVVEDEAPVRELVCAILGNHGYQILQAESGAKAVELWKQTKTKVDLLLTDLVMPDRINGRELADRLRTEQPSLKVIFTSGYSADVVGKDFVLQQGLFYLQKPYDPQKLALTVRDCLDARAQN